MEFKLFVYDRMKQRVSVTVEPMTQQDAARTSEEPKWQTDWNSEYIAQSGFDIYALKTQAGELIALGAYEISEDVIAGLYGEPVGKQSNALRASKISGNRACADRLRH